MAVSPVGYDLQYPYSYSGLYASYPGAYSSFDQQCLMTALNSPNINAMQASLNQQNGDTTATTKTPNVSFQGNDASVSIAQQGTKKKSNAGWILLVLSAIGTTILGIKAHKMGTGTGFFEKIKDGLGKIWKSGVAKVKNIGKGVTSSDKNNVFTMSQTGDNYVCEIPSRTNVLTSKKMNEEQLKASLEKLGLKSETSENIAEAVKNGSAKVREYSFKHGDYNIFVNLDKDGNQQIWKITKGTKGKNAENIMKNLKNATDNVEQNSYKSIQELFNTYKKEFNLNNVSDVVYQKEKDGALFIYKVNQDGSSALNKVFTKKFDINSTSAKAYIDRNNLGETVKNFKNGSKDGWKIKTADYKIDDIGTLKIENDKIVGITVKEGDKYVYHKADSDAFRALHLDADGRFEKIFESTNRDKFTNVVYVPSS